MKYSLVIPVLNEEKNIIKLVQKIEKANTSNIIDIIFVDGGSTDNTVKIINKAGFAKKLLSYKGNQKLSGQLQLGYIFSIENNYEGVITMDGNNKDDPEFIPRFISKLEKGYDFIQGSRFMTGGSSVNLSLFRNLMINYIHVPLLNLGSNYKFTDTTQGYRAYSKKVLTDSKIGLMNKKFKRYQLLLCATTLIPKYNYKCIEVPNTRTYSTEGGQTKFNFSNLVLYFLDIINYSLRIKFKK